MTTKFLFIRFAKHAMQFLLLMFTVTFIYAESSAVYTQEIAPDVYSYSSGDGYHSMFLVTNGGVAVFESINTPHSTAMSAAIKDVTDQPIKFVIASHNHWDHISGGKVFQDQGAKVVMHSLAAQWLAANPGRDTTPPDVVWDGAKHTITLGGTDIELNYLGLNHGLGMTVSVIPEKRVAYMADIVTPNRVMFSIVPDFNIGEWQRTLGEVLELNFDVAVCSHSELPLEQIKQGCTKEHVAEERQYIIDLRNAIIQEFQKGTPAQEIPGSVRLPQYSNWKHYDDWLALNAQRMMLDMWMGPYPWVPSN